MNDRTASFVDGRYSIQAWSDAQMVKAFELERKSLLTIFCYEQHPWNMVQFACSALERERRGRGFASEPVQTYVEASFLVKLRVKAA